MIKTTEDDRLASSALPRVRNPVAEPIGAPPQTPAIPVAHPIPFEVPELYDPEDQQAALACELGDPEDQKIYDQFPPEKKRRFRFFYDLATSSPSATIRGFAITKIESAELFGRELKIYGKALTDSWRKASDTMGEMRAYVREHHGVFSQVANARAYASQKLGGKSGAAGALWDTVTEMG